MQLDKLARKPRGPPVSASLTLGLQVHRAVPGFLHRFRRSKSGPHAYTANTVPIVPHPQPQKIPTFPKRCRDWTIMQNVVIITVPGTRVVLQVL